MTKEALKELLEAVAAGETAPEDALEQIRLQPYRDLGFAKVDTQRGVRQGAAEVIYGAGKTVDQIIAITQELLASGEKSVLITRLSADAAAAVGKAVPLFYDPTAKLAVAGERPAQSDTGHIVIATGGTSDIPVAEEAALTAEFYGNRVTRLYDVGVAGVHRLLDNTALLAEARVVIAVAGMEGALASVVGGLVDCPVIAVPTSVGYGATFEGLAALLAMLNSCASGVSVVNIDNGFGAGYLAGMINKM